MKRIILAITMSVTLASAGCQSMQNLEQAFSAASNFTVTQNELDAARNTYDGTALATLHSYAALPRCPKGTAISLHNTCHDRALLKTMRSADNDVTNAFNATQDQITSGNNAGAVAAYKTLGNTITAIKKIMSDNNLSLI